ncbi:FAD-dependent monooxygenase [Pantoea sp. Ae16]|uniref:FAD-dependent monooxygenase n=1 Tax=Pantoea sp. Ae16 TaxID=1890373 RepID=UPI0008FCFD6F|nr:FAD-dependent monooxygenase [Pantoea sp. Ae16]OIX90684.1 monooxygenase [Pantoea sp. Ae16]
MTRSKKIAIVGAGIAGIALAILATRQGHKVSIFERGSNVSSIGAGVTLWPNAMFVMQQMGLDEKVSQVGGTPCMMRQFDRYGLLQTEFDISAVNSLCGFPSVTVLRRELMSLLAGALDSLGCEIKFSCSITAADVMKLGKEFDLVVGADGRMNSVVRQALYAKRIPIRYHGFVNVIGVGRQREGTLSNAINDFRGRGERFGIVPVNNGLCYWAGAWNAPVNDERPQARCFDELHQRFRDWPDPVQNVLHSCDKASVKCIFVHDIDPLPFWHQDNILMIGDAAHASLPTSGQGACQALEDAWHLARLLRETDDMDIVTESFYQQRHIKTSAAQLIGRQFAKKIFSEQPEPQLPVSTTSSAELSRFWMQGLTHIDF